MNINGIYYDGVVGKPFIDDALSHYGVKGMRWRRRKGKQVKTSKKRLDLSFLNDLSFLKGKISKKIPEQKRYTNITKDDWRAKEGGLATGIYSKKFGTDKDTPWNYDESATRRYEEEQRAGKDPTYKKKKK